ncbi:hypothetical protein R6Z07F_011516 [Ovis aries]
MILEEEGDEPRNVPFKGVNQLEVVQAAHKEHSEAVRSRGGRLDWPGRRGTGRNCNRSGGERGAGGRGHRRWGPDTRPWWLRERHLRAPNCPPPKGKRSAWRTKESPRAAARPPIGAGLGAAQRARSLPPPSAPAPAAAAYPSCRS